MSPWQCHEYLVSSSTSEKWSASGTKGKGNIATEDSKDICLLHLSGDVTSVGGSYETEMSFGRPYCQYSASTSVMQFYAGTGTSSAVLPVELGCGDFTQVIPHRSGGAPVVVAASEGQGHGNIGLAILLMHEPDQGARSTRKDAGQAEGRRHEEEPGLRGLGQGVIAACLMVAVRVSVVLAKLVWARPNERKEIEGDPE
jgi:hypothetical protein